MTQISLPFGSSNSGTNDWSDVYSNDEAITNVVNGNLDDTNLAANVIGPNELTSALAEDLGVDQTSNVRRGVTSIATEETTTSTSYTTLTTPDQVANVVLPTNGLLYVTFRALWKLTGATNAGAVGIFLGANQVKSTADNAVPTEAGVSLAAAGDNYGTLLTHQDFTLGTAPSGTSDSSFVTTGQVVLGTGVGNTASWATIPIEAAAGTYTVSIKYKVNATAGGTLSVKERKLWVKAEGY